MSIFTGLINLVILVVLGTTTRVILIPLMSSSNPLIVFVSMFSAFLLGIYLLRETSKIIQNATAVLKDRTNIMGKLLQPSGAAFSNIIIGVVAAILSWMLTTSDPVKSVNLSILATTTIFGSFAYIIFFAVWCIYRQNVANRKGKIISVVPLTGIAGLIKPIKLHKTNPKMEDFDNIMQIIGYFSFIVSLVTLGIIGFGKIIRISLTTGFYEILLQLSKPFGIVILLVCLGIILKYNKNKPKKEIYDVDNIYGTLPTSRMLMDLSISIVIITFAAEAIVRSISLFAQLTHTSYLIMGLITAFIACIGEISKIHNHTINPSGKIPESLVNIFINNIVAIMVVSFVTVLGGLFRGNITSLIIFMLILLANTLLTQQVHNLKNYYLRD